MPEAQAKVQAETLQNALKDHRAENRKILASDEDIRVLRLERKEMELRLLKWQIGIAVALPILTALAKSFQWFGF